MRLLCCAFLVLAGSAAAAPRLARFEYALDAAAAACPDARAVRNAVAGRLGYNPFRDDATSSVAVQVTAKPGGLKATIALRRAPDEPPRVRELGSSALDCRELAEAIALAVSIAIDPLGQGAPPPPTPSEPPVPVPEPLAPQAPPEPEPVVVKPVETAPPPPVPATWSLGIGPAGSLGIGPSPSAGLVVDARLRWSRMSLGVEARADVPTTAPLLDGRVTSSLLAAGVSACLHFSWVVACTAGAGGAVRSSSQGFADARTVWVPYVAVGARAGIEVPLSDHWSLRGTADLLVRPVRVTLLVNDQPAWESPPLQGSLNLAALVHFR